MRFLALADGKDKTNIDEQQDKELLELGSRLSDLENKVDLNNKNFVDYKNEPNIDKDLAHFIDLTVDNSIAADNMTVNSANINDITSKNIEANTITVDIIKTDDIASDNITTDNIETNTITGTTATLDGITSKNIVTDNIKSDTAKFNTLTIDNATITTFNINDIDTNDIKTETIEATKAQMEELAADKATINIIESDAAHLRWIQAHNITFDGSQNELEPYYMHIEPQDTPSETDFRVIELPYFDTGDYYLSLRHPGADIAWWSVIVHNNHNNITVSYSRRITDIAGADIPNPTLSEFYVHDYFSNTPRLYIKTYVGGNLYWQNQSLNKETQPIIHDDWPIDIASFGALNYKCLHDGATWYTKHVDIIRNQSANWASLFLIPGTWAEAERRQVEFNGLVDVPWKFYLPDQSLNTTDEVTFKNIVIKPLEGKWVYNKEDALMGMNPETIGNDGQLNAAKNIIETEELIKWNGKVGTTQNNHTIVDGTIFREQGYTQTSDHVYEKRDVYTYDTVEWNNKLVRTDTLAVRRKADDAIITSNAPIMGQYEDEGQVVWNEYRYVFPDIMNGNLPAFEVWIDRQLADGSWTQRLLQTTVDQTEYTNYIRHKQEFEYGTIDYDVYSFDNYHNPIKYLGDVTEGRWNAGDIHVTKKTNPPNSAEPAYDGNLEVDGTTTLHDNVTVVKADGTKVDNVTINATEANINATDLNIEVDNDKNVVVKGNSVTEITGNDTTTINGNKTATIDGDTVTTIDGTKQDTVNENFTLHVGGDITETATNKDITLTNDNTLNAVNNTVTLTGKDLLNATDREVEVDNEKHTYKSIEFIGHNESETDFNFLIRDNVEIGKEDDPHDLVVHGTITPDNIAFEGDAGDNIRLRDVDGKILMQAEKCAEVIDGVLQSEDKLITADVLGTWNGEVSDAIAGGTYPITEIGDKSTVHGDINVEKTLEAQHIKARETIDTVDLFARQNAVIEKDVTIHGNLVVDGKVLAADKESLNTSADYAILRKDVPTGLGASMKSGLVVHNFDGNGTSASIAVDKDGTFRVANTAAEHTTDYTNTSYWSDTGIYYEGISTTQKDVDKGAIVKQDADDYEAVLYNGKYYHNTENTKWYELYLANDRLTFDINNPITDDALVVVLSGLAKHQIIYYRTLSITVIDDNADQPILTRAESDDFYDKAPLMWDANNNKAVKIIDDAPPKKNLTIVTQIDMDSGELSYKWGKAGSGAGAVLVMTQAEYDTRVLITNMDDDEYIPNNALVCISDADNEYLNGEE